jgi:hypothetical protein
LTFAGVWTDDAATSGGPLMDLVVGGHQGQTFALSEPNIDRIRGTQPSRNGHALNAPRALRPNGHQRRVREKSCHEPVDLRRREARAREG